MYYLNIFCIKTSILFTYLRFGMMLFPLLSAWFIVSPNLHRPQP